MESFFIFFNTDSIIDSDCMQYQSVIIIGEDIKNYEFEIPEGDYLSYIYDGPKDQNFEHLRKAKAYLKRKHLAFDSNVLELLIIDTHEISDICEHRTEIQIDAI